MKAVTWHGKRDVRVEEVPDPEIEEPTDAIIEVTSTNICGSDLHLYEVLGRVHGRRATSSATSRWASSRRSATDVTNLAVGDRVVIPFHISCGTAPCATSSSTPSARPPRSASRAWGGAVRLLRSCTAQVPGGQAEFLRVPQAQFTHIKVPDGPPDDRFVYLSDVLPTAWQAVAYADIPDGGIA